MVSFTVENGVTPKTERYEREQLVRGDKASKKYKETRLDDIVYNPANLKFGAISRNKYGNAVFSPIYVTYEVNKSLALPPYIEMYVTRDTFIQNALQYQQGTVYERMSVNTEDFATLEIMLPSKNEQRVIGEFFDNLDNLITLHRCLYHKIRWKIYLTDAVFTLSWEQRKLGDMLDRYEDPVETPHDGYERIGIRSHAKGVFHSYVEPGKELDTAKMHRVAADKFILNITFAWEHAVAITEEEDAGALVSHRFPQFSFHKDLKSHFFKFLMLDRKFREYLELCSPGGAGRNRVLNINDMLKYKINVPSVEEQTKIGEYFDNLDNLITLHQRKCDELKEVKKYMLQNMFPQKG